ncbi:MAG: helix-hairpin-helix domain-containing protein [Acidimicrobiales bacterium]|nr:helix-hairpin-helix domain-containing protein [Acidimicrobiales bacterium]
MAELHEIRGVGPATATRLADHGITSVAALAQADLDSVVAVPGFGPVRAAAVQAAALAALDAASAPEGASPPTRPGAEVGKVDKAKADTSKTAEAGKAKAKKAGKAKVDKAKTAKAGKPKGGKSGKSAPTKGKAAKAGKGKRKKSAAGVAAESGKPEKSGKGKKKRKNR